MSGAREQGLILFHSGLPKHNVKEWTLNEKSEDLSSHPDTNYVTLGRSSPLSGIQSSSIKEVHCSKIESK